MESTSTYLADRLKELLTEGTWVTGTNYLDQIKGLDWHVATQSVHGLNSIALLTFHIHYYIAGVKQVLEGGELEIRDKFSFDAAPIASEADWAALVERFERDAHHFIDLVAKMTEEQLAAGFVKEEYGSYQRNIDVMIEHCYYHLGQILLIKKLIPD